MTPQQILDASRNNLNATNDTLWSDTELLIDLYLVELELARKTLCIENTSTDTTVASQTDYTRPARAIEIWRVMFDGNKLQKISKRELDQLNFNTSVTVTGLPRFYSEFNELISLYPTPDAGSASKTIQYFTYDEPTVPTASSTLEVPTAYHDVLVAGLTKRMCPKDLGNPQTILWADEWARGVQETKQEIRKRRRSDKFSVVATEEQNLTTNFGII